MLVFSGASSSLCQAKSLESQLSEASSFILNELSKANILHHFEFAIICGSGLQSSLSEKMQILHQIPYNSIPHFPPCKAHGHLGKMVFVLCENEVPCILMLGRCHFYEGYTWNQVSMHIRTLSLLGVQKLIITTAAGALNPAFQVGDLMQFDDHLNLPGLCGQNALLGADIQGFESKFLPMTDAYSSVFSQAFSHFYRELSNRASAPLKVHFGGVHVTVSGPSFETRAECRMLRALGGDSVSMSGACSALIARQCRMEIMSFAFITNKCAFLPEDSAPSFQEVLDVGKNVGGKVIDLIVDFLVYYRGMSFQK